MPKVNSEILKANLGIRFTGNHEKINRIFNELMEMGQDEELQRNFTPENLAKKAKEQLSPEELSEIKNPVIAKALIHKLRAKLDAENSKTTLYALDPEIDKGTIRKMVANEYAQELLNDVEAHIDAQGNVNKLVTFKGNSSSHSDDPDYTASHAFDIINNLKQGTSPAKLRSYLCNDRQSFDINKIRPYFSEEIFDELLYNHISQDPQKRQEIVNLILNKNDKPKSAVDRYWAIYRDHNKDYAENSPKFRRQLSETNNQAKSSIAEYAAATATSGVAVGTGATALPAAATVAASIAAAPIVVPIAIVGGLIGVGTAVYKYGNNMDDLTDKKQALYEQANKDLRHYMVIYELKRLIEHDRISVQEVNNILKSNHG